MWLCGWQVSGVCACECVCVCVCRGGCLVLGSIRFDFHKRADSECNVTIATELIGCHEKSGELKKRGDKAHMCSCDCTHTHACDWHNKYCNSSKKTSGNEQSMRFLIISPLAVCEWSRNLRVVSGSAIKNIRKQSYLQTRNTSALLLSTDKETKAHSKFASFVWRSCIFRAFSDAKIDSDQLYYCSLKWL